MHASGYYKLHCILLTTLVKLFNMKVNVSFLLCAFRYTVVFCYQSTVMFLAYCAPKFLEIYLEQAIFLLLQASYDF